MSPNKQYTKIFGQDGYMEIGEFCDFRLKSGIFRIFEPELKRMKLESK